MLSVFPLLFAPQQTIRELFDMNDGEKREAAVELSVPQADEEEAINKQSTTILEQVRRLPTLFVTSLFHIKIFQAAFQMVSVVPGLFSAVDIFLRIE